MLKQRWFLAGLFCTTMSALLLVVLDTRLLSVLTWYHFALFAVSAALFGFAAGAVHVYLGGARFEGDVAPKQLAGASLAYALSVPVLHILIVHVPLTAFLMAIPFYFGGIVIGVALTRIPGPIGVTYCAALVGAAAACLLAVPLLSYTDISSAIFAAAAIGVAGSLCFCVCVGQQVRLWLTGALLPLCIAATIYNGVAGPHAVRLIHEKGAAQFPVDLWQLDGVLHGNRVATAILLLLLAVSVVLVALTILLPLKLAHRGKPRPPHFSSAVLYFAFIGAGFMMVQIPFLQRFSAYLGHPTYAVGVVLFSMLFFTGIGSLLSDRLPLRLPVLVALPCLIAAVLVVAMGSVGQIIQATGALPLAARCLVVLAYAAPISLPLGCCFPLGMRLLGGISDATAPWMWGVTTACGVMASALGVCLSLWLGIDASLALAAGCYLVLSVPAMNLYRAGVPKPVAPGVYADGTRADAAQLAKTRPPKSNRIGVKRLSAWAGR